MTHQIIDVSADDGDILAQIARLHIAEIGAGFLSTLGPRVLKDLYHTLSQSDGSFVVVAATKDREVLGFLAGGYGTHSLYREHLKLRDFGAKVRLAWALIRPSRLRRILETLRYSEKEDLTDSLPHAEILNFCVTKTGQRKGLGQALMAASDARFKAAGIDRIRIVTGQSQKSAQAFYAKIGAKQISKIEIHAGVTSTLFLWDPSTLSRR